MTKQEWLGNDLNQMLHSVKSQRKKHLFSLACCRSVQHLIQNQISKDCLEKFELFIDGKIDEQEFELARQAAWTVYDAYDAAGSISARTVAWAAARVIAFVNNVYWNAYYAVCANFDNSGNGGEQTGFLKDIYNPNLIQLTFPQKAIELAQEVYDTNNPTTRLILSDFLEENHFPEELYLHLKLPTHYKGCWVIDQILNKL